MSRIIFSVWLISTFAEAGWVSSGGRQIDSSMNPWLLKLHESPKYCIEFSSSDMGIALDTAKSLVVEALAYWRFELTRNPSTPDRINIGGYDAAYQANCSAGIDITLKFGSSTLDQEERLYLGDRLDSIVGIAIRKSYDKPTMRGRGVIFINNSRTIETPNGSTLVWSEHHRLLKVIVHELGHVFGIEHISRTIMDESGPDHWYKAPKVDSSIASLSNHDRLFADCNYHRERMSDFLANDIRPGSCIAITNPFAKLGGEVLELRKDGSTVILGEISASESSSSYQIPIRVYLNSEQNIFATKSESLPGNYFLREIELSNAVLKTERDELPVFFELSSSRVKLAGFWRGRIVNLLDQELSFGSW